MSFDDQIAWGALLQLVLTLGLLITMFWALFRRRKSSTGPVSDGPEDELYRIFTMEFDRELLAKDVPDSLLGLSRDFANGHFETTRTAWDCVIEKFENMTDGLPLPDYRIDRDLNETAITLLVDQSGSMKGDRIVWAAAGVRRLTDLLLARCATVEVLGFSTAGWRGGLAREKWFADGKPKRPGRLCALLHSIYKEADASALEHDDLRVMLNPNILRENVDGESIEWAARRLRRRQETAKQLIVFSDGAPVDAHGEW
jgi:cobaltochelatase CobT